ncbi:O-methyltransferase [Shivajiella indica]|uniref:O-methyltransferase n=1 Tax=Shivajiella indica TaxID=872115 RepID=A0ABW5B9W1_9BACT
MVYWLKKEDRYSLQSPFISEIYRDLQSFLIDSQVKDLELEEIRENLLKDQEVLEIEDFGAGSIKLKKNKFRKTSNVTKYSTTGRKFSQVYQYFCNLTPANHVLELGTCVGINTKYLDKVTKGELFTFEGSEALWRKAQEKPISKRTHFLLGNIKDILPQHLEEKGKVDFVLIDATHNYQGSLIYYETLRSYIHETSIIILADIHWSKEMEKAWKEIIQFPEVTLSIDFYECGVLFFRKSLSKTHYILSI